MSGTQGHGAVPRKRPMVYYVPRGWCRRCGGLLVSTESRLTGICGMCAREARAKVHPPTTDTEA